MSDNFERKRTQTLVLIGIMAAAITGLTMILKIAVPPYGYLNLGDVGVMLSALLLPFRGAVVAAGLGSMMADILGGYPQYAFFTLFIKALEVLIIILLKRYLKKKYYAIPFFAAGLTMAVLYAGVDGVLLQSFTAFLWSLLNNLPQGIVSATIVSLLYPRFKGLLDRLRSLET